MPHESEVIPYEPSVLAGERLLVLAPHPDDEVIGCGGVVAWHLAEARPVRIVVVTDGAEAATGDPDPAAYRVTREQESRRGLDILGKGAEVVFLGYPDRGLDDRVAATLREQLLDFRPDLVLVPSPIEIHPDHEALARAFCDLVARDELLHADLAVTRVAFYEVSQPLRPNTLVDITAVAALKFDAIAAHGSQMANRDYVALARGLNAYRAMTLPAPARYAEAYWVTDLARLRTTSYAQLRDSVGTPPRAQITRETVPISVIVRTKDRPALLAEAVGSIRATGYPAEIVVVNDGGATPRNLEGVRVIEHTTSLGRSEAMNRGVREAGSRFIAFLDDDDIFYTDHLSTLATATETSHVAWYTDALSAFLRIGAGGTYETHSRLRLFGHDFDRQLLLADNYIPLTTLLVPRDTYLDLGGFDPQFDLFEDWDFLIRLSRRGELARVPRLTCEIRHVEGGRSVTLGAPEGSAAFREAKRRVWKKHSDVIGEDLFADVIERQKRRSGELYSSLVEEKGRRQHLERDIGRLQREKQILLDELQVAGGAARALERDIEILRDTVAGRQREVDERGREIARLATQIHDNGRTMKSLYLEIDRLQGLLDTIFRSRTWKFHTIVERMKGR